MVLQLRDQVSAIIAGVEDRWLLVEAVQVPHGFQAQTVFVRPVLVDGGLADSRSIGDGIHAGGIDAALGKQFDSRVHHLLVRQRASPSRHPNASSPYASILENS